MIIPDVNLLLYAVITGFPQHARARTWWEGAINGQSRVGLTHVSVFGFLRIATNARVLDSPMSIDDATAYVHGWASYPNVDVLSPGVNHLSVATRLLRQVGTAGNLTTDVQLATFAIEHRGTVHSNDTDFGRFPDVSWVDPLRDSPSA